MECESCGCVNCQHVEDNKVMTCGDCDHLSGEECWHRGCEANAGDSACDYFATSNAELTGYPHEPQQKEQ